MRPKRVGECVAPCWVPTSCCMAQMVSKSWNRNRECDRTHCSSLQLLAVEASHCERKKARMAWSFKESKAEETSSWRNTVASCNPPTSCAQCFTVYKASGTPWPLHAPKQHLGIDHLSDLSAIPWSPISLSSIGRPLSRLGLRMQGASIGRRRPKSLIRPSSVPPPPPSPPWRYRYCWHWLGPWPPRGWGSSTLRCFWWPGFARFLIPSHPSPWSSVQKDLAYSASAFPTPCTGMWWKGISPFHLCCHSDRVRAYVPRTLRLFSPCTPTLWVATWWTSPLSPIRPMTSPVSRPMTSPAFPSIGFALRWKTPSLPKSRFPPSRPLQRTRRPRIRNTKNSMSYLLCWRRRTPVLFQKMRSYVQETAWAIFNTCIEMRI